MAEIIKINVNTYRIEDNGVRFFLLAGTEKAALIDSGRGTPDARKIAESLTALPMILINTHADPDHVSGNAAFENAYMSPAEEPHYRSVGGANPVIPVNDGDEIDLGNRTLRIIDNPGHTPGSIAILDVENRVLIGGDSIQDGNIYMFGPGRDIKKYISSMKKIQTISGDFDVIYPSHSSFPVYPDIMEKLTAAAEEITAGRAAGTPMTLHGNEILLYKFDCAGFYCDR